MRSIVLAISLVLGAASVAAASQWPVVVTTDTGATIRGRLLSITPERVTLSHRGRLEPIPTERVVRIVKRRDSVLDGFLKGVLIGAVPLLLLSDGVDGGWATRYIATYAVIGTGLDALEGRSFVVYDRSMQPPVPPSIAPKVGWTVRF